MRKLEFTTTACNRPELLEKTYKSFTTHLKGVDFKNSTVYINADPAVNGVDIEKIEVVANKYFGNVFVNYPKRPNFAAAVVWVWSQVKGDYFFHLEDDWKMECDVDIEDMISQLESHDVAQCCLRQKFTLRSPYLCDPMLPPSLWKTSINKKYLSKMHDRFNPEEQIMILFYQKNVPYGSVFLKDSKEMQCNDIGHAWRRSRKIGRNYEEMRKNKVDTLKNADGKLRHNKRGTPWIRWDK